jgi:hypothetical protein
MDHTITVTNCPKHDSQFSCKAWSHYLAPKIQSPQTTQPSKVMHQCSTRLWVPRYVFTTCFWLLLAGVGANSDCDWFIDNRELPGLCFPFLCQNSTQAWCGQVCLPHWRHQAFVKLACAHNRATTTMGINILTENHEWVCFVNYSDPDSKCQ